MLRCGRFDALRTRRAAQLGSRWFRYPNWEVNYAPAAWPGEALFDRPADAETRWAWARATTYVLGLRVRF